MEYAVARRMNFKVKNRFWNDFSTTDFSMFGEGSFGDDLSGDLFNNL
ncbi:MAG: hypothetical protein LBT50_00520 [Prevotellaceae bacterium]|jgi:hypothetical protein|nr:hypothetical protein [Prevotellaceae bacterium]